MFRKRLNTPFSEHFFSQQRPQICITCSKEERSSRCGEPEEPWGNFAYEYLDSFPLVMKIMAICSPACVSDEFQYHKSFIGKGEMMLAVQINPDQLNFTFTQKIPIDMNIFSIIVTLGPDGSLYLAC